MSPPELQLAAGEMVPEEAPEPKTRRAADQDPARTLRSVPLDDTSPLSRVATVSKRFEPTAPPFDLVAGRFRIRDLLGEGGMGVVYRAADEQTGDDVAVKLVKIRDSEDLDVLRRFRREFAALSRLDHPNVIDVLDYGVEQGIPFLVLELIDGRTLAAIIKAEGPLAAPRLLSVMTPIVAALGYIHGQGLVHRDVKPSNIMVQPNDVAKLMDFGLIRDLEDDATAELGGIRGTFLYLSPEQACELPTDARSDLFSVGVLLYEAATGRVPFTDRNGILCLLNRIVERDPPPPSTFNPNIPARLERAIMRLLRKDPIERYQSALELLDDLRPLGADAFPASAGGASVLFRPALVGRKEELRRIEAYLPRPGALAPSPVLLVSGEAGIGKTRLLAEELRSLCRLSAIRFKRVRLNPDETAPFLAIVEVLESLEELIRPAVDAADAELRDDLRYLAHLSSHFAALFGEPRGAPRGGVRMEVLDRLLALALREIRLVVVLDNIQFADPLSLEFLLRTARRAQVPGAERQPILWIGAYTLGEASASPALLRLVRALQRGADRHSDALADPGHVIELSRLATEDVQRMLATMCGTPIVDASIAARVVSESEGIPLLVEQAVQELFERGILQRKGRRLVATKEILTVSLTGGLREMLQNRLDRLDEEELELTELAAVLGERFSLGDLMTVAAPRPEDAVDDLVRKLVHTGILREAAGDRTGERFAFTHHRLHELVLERMRPTRSRLLHRRAAEALEVSAVSRGPAVIATLAHHFRCAGMRGKASHFAARAAEAFTLEQAHEAALEMYEQALDDIESVQSDELDVLWRRKSRVLRQLASLSSAVGKYASALDYFEELRDVGKERCSLAIEGDALAEMGLLHLLLGNEEKSQVLLSSAHEIFAGGGLELDMMRILVLEGEICFALGEALKARPRFAEAVSSSCGNADDSFAALNARALMHLAGVDFASGETESAREWLQRAMSVLGVREEPKQGMTECYRQAMAAADRRGWGSDLLPCLFSLAEWYLTHRRFAEGITYARETVVWARRIDHKPLLARALTGLGEALRWGGEVAAALAAHQEAMSIVEAMNGHDHWARIHRNLAMDYHVEGRLEDALRVLREGRLLLGKEVGTKAQGEVLLAQLELEHAFGGTERLASTLKRLADLRPQLTASQAVRFAALETQCLLEGSQISSEAEAGRGETPHDKSDPQARTRTTDGFKDGLGKVSGASPLARAADFLEELEQLDSRTDARTDVSEARRRLELAAQRGEHELDELDRAILALSWARVCCRAGGPEEAQHHAEYAMARFAGCGATMAAGWSAVVCAKTQTILAHLEDAQRFAETGASIGRGAGCPQLIAMANLEVARSALRQGNVDRARSAYRDSLLLLRSLEERIESPDLRLQFAHGPWAREAESALEEFRALLGIF
ncbi:MAG: protein kinase [Candidatus Schekmanbacteria bacterium]|nr:protein kinase [Candidatus Schekmanbacteria bacterium]